ncbi:MAG: histone H1 [Proteobacteria bacterium]|nr:histone H1 [Pseudomonadota bacterium]
MKTTRKKHPDLNELAAAIIAEATEEEKPKPEDKRNPAAVALGRLGGLKGGRARANKLTPERRKEIAQKAAKTRWKKSLNQN